MCGIAGFVLKNPIASGEELRARVQAMSSLLVHRGPDATGDWVDPEEGISLGHRRLSILDLSEHAAQPMVSANGRWVLSYNGEIYNLSELREKLASYGTSLRSHSDTELLLEMCAHEGVAATLEQIAGMFAFALWDRQEKKLWLVRDRLGIKPLYWYQMPCGGVAFASELQAFDALPSPPDEVDPRGGLITPFRQCFSAAINAEECIQTYARWPALHQGRQSTDEQAVVHHARTGGKYCQKSRLA